MTNLYPGLRKAAMICLGLAREHEAKMAATPHSPANTRRRAESRALRRAAARITDAMLDESLPVSPIPLQCRRYGCRRTSTHASGMCDEHQPGFAQVDDREQAA